MEVVCIEFYVLFSSFILIICAVSSKLSDRFGFPMLLLFIVLGMMFGSDGIFGIEFDNYELSEQICSIALVFIMFYGGFGTNWKMARPIAMKAILLSTVGVIITAVLTGVFCFKILNMNLLEGMLVGAIISSTDAASVFSVLRSKNLNLKNGLTSLLEIESGSNDPFSYMMTMIILTLISNKGSNFIYHMIITQIFFGVLFGVLIGVFSAIILKKVSFEMKGLHTVFTVAIALMAYSLPMIFNGNGYLSVYISGLILGNSKIHDKVELVHFFDGITWLTQILLFFLLGLLSFPSQMPSIIFTSIIIVLFLTFIARPVAVFTILMPFKVPIKQQILVSWAGLRGAASIVFAIFCVNSNVPMKNDIFHIVFCVALFSVSVQGTLLPYISRKLELVDDSESVLKTFTDYQDETDIKLIELIVKEKHPWIGKLIKDLKLSSDSLIVMIKRDNDTVIPNGYTKIHENDILVVGCNPDKNSVSEFEPKEWNI